MKILILRLSSIGDILLATPFIRQTRIAFPGAHIDVMTKADYAELLRFNKHPDAILSLNTKDGKPGLRRMRDRIRQSDYDYIFDLHNNFRTNYLLYGLKKTPVFKISKNKLIRALLVYTKINLYKNIQPIPLRYLQVGQAVGVEDDGKSLELDWDGETEKQVNRIKKRNGIEAPYLVVAPGAGFYTKQWPLEYVIELFGQLLSTFPGKIVIVGSGNEVMAFKKLEISDKIVNLTGRLRLLETACMISGSELVLANDSGVMHMATAVQSKVLVVFGSTVKELGFFPFRGNSRVMENEELWCRPCSHVGRKRCPFGHFKCMKEITPEQVFKAITELMES